MSASSSPLSTSDRRRHFLFVWSCGCGFSVMTREVAATENAAWAEAFETSERIQAAREEGVRLLEISHDEWIAEHEARFGKCTHNPPKLPPRVISVVDPSPIEIEVDNDSEVIVGQFVELLDEGSDYWNHLSALIERLSPGISPYDRREAVAEALAPLKMVITDAFW